MRLESPVRETHEEWPGHHRYLNMEFLKEQKKDLIQTEA